MTQITESSRAARTFDQGDLRHSPRMTLEFFARIRRPIETITWQTFDDNKHRKAPALVSTKFGAGHSQALAGLNRRGAGVFFAVNKFGGTRHKWPDLESIVCLHADFDHGVPENCAIQPTARVQSSICPETGLVKEQWFWKLEDGQSLMPDQHQAAMKWIVGPIEHRGLGGDPEAKDACRVLRVPGFFHRKGEPQRVELVGIEGPLYTASQLLDAAAMFRPPPSPPRLAMVPRQIDFADRYVAAAVNGVAAELSRAVEPGRNGALNRAAFRLGQLGIGLDQATAILGPIALNIGLDPEETPQTIKSGITAGAANPREGRAAA